MTAATFDLTAILCRCAQEGSETPLLAHLASTPDPEQVLAQASQQLGYRLMRVAQLKDARPLLDLLPLERCAKLRCALFASESEGRKSTALLVVNPFDTDLVAWAVSCFGELELWLASEATFDAWFAQCEASQTALDSLVSGYASDSSGSRSGAEALSIQGIAEDSSPTIKLVNVTLLDALRCGASDIHLECDHQGLTIKYRLDGALTTIRRIEGTTQSSQTISRVKVMADLDISESRVPQDGRLQLEYQGRFVDVRVSIMPSIHGEDAVLRVLDRQHLAQTLAGLTLSKLGFDDAIASDLRALCRRPHGMVLVTGPTGSGKTTTLYAAIAETHQARDKIITIEDPVEYQLPGVLQIPVNERKGLTFARGLRSILRHDPDRILVGEIRDAETAQIAIQASLTGHLVFTTIHANTALDAVGRFEQLGIDPHMFSSAVSGVLAQRLMRKLCDHCKKPSAADSICTAQLLQVPAGQVVAMSAGGCETCRGTGYRGRLAIGELLALSPKMRGLIASRTPYDQLQEAAGAAGWRSLYSQALRVVAQGRTSLEEADRVST